MRKRFQRLKHYLVPHARNGYKPRVFAKESVAVLVLVLVLVEAVYVFGTPFILQQTGFTAAVLPAALTDLTNTDRIASGNIALTPDPLLAQAAQKKADDMAAKGYFAHVSPEGRTPWYWFDAVGYEYTYAGENLAINFTDSIDVETAWMNSPDHHANIVKPQYTQIGIGTAQGMYEGKETTFVVELFATLPSKAPTPTPRQPVVSVPKTVEPLAPSGESAVLGAQAQENTSRASENTTASKTSGGNLAATVASSPNHVMMWLLGLFATFITILLALAIFGRMKVRYLEAVGGGAVLLALVVGLLFFNESGVQIPRVPFDGQAASVALVLPLR